MSALTESAFVPDYVHYTDPEFCAEFAADMARESPLSARFGCGRAVLRYDPRQFDFRGPVLDALGTAGMLDGPAPAGLERLHELVPAEHQVMDSSQQSAAARQLYDLPPAFSALYARFLGERIGPALGLGPLHYQQVPTFRVFFPAAPGYPGATSYHNDIMLGHNPREVNVFVPLVRCAGTRSLLLASLPDSLELLARYAHDYARFGRDTQLLAETQAACAAICRPLEVGVGDAVVFDSRCIHAGPANTTPLTRVTFDTRVLPAAAVRRQRNRYRGRGRRRAEFVPGAYFSTATT